MAPAAACTSCTSPVLPPQVHREMHHGASEEAPEHVRHGDTPVLPLSAHTHDGNIRSGLENL
eukprot:2312418-Amphidinium_carterae.1